jgi:hypothetical protein
MMHGRKSIKILICVLEQQVAKNLEWISLAQDRNQRWKHVNTVIRCGVLYTMDNLNGQTPIASHKEL